MRDTRNRAGAMIVCRDGRREPEAVVLLADALVKTAGDEQVDGLGMRIGRVDVAARIERQAEGIRLAIRENLEPRTVRAETIRVAAGVDTIVCRGRAFAASDSL
jgi:hypothetical protein